MDRTIGKSENRNNDGERLMISLFEIAKSVKERASTDTYNTKSIGREDGETWDHAKGFAAKHKGEIRYFDINDYPEDMSNDEVNAAAEKDAKAYAKTGKVANPKDAKKGGDDSEKDAGGKLGGGDFDRDGGDEPDMDSDDDYDDDDEDDDKNASEKENEKIEKELNSIADYFGGLTVGSEDANHGGEIHNLIGKDDDSSNYLGFHAAPKYDDDGNETDEIQYAIEVGSGSSPIYFDSKEEANKSLKKMLGDKKVKRAMNGEGDETLLDLGDHAKSIVDDAKKPESELEKLDKEIKSTEATRNSYQGDSSDPRNQDMANDLTQKLEKLKADREKLAGGSDKNETKVINGVKYKRIQESKKHPLKENYDRIFRSRK